MLKTLAKTFAPASHSARLSPLPQNGWERDYPILNHDEDEATIREITLLDPLDLVTLPLVISNYGQLQSDGMSDQQALTAAILNTLNGYGYFEQNKSQLEVCWDPLIFWRNYARSANLADDLTEEIAQELANSVKWQGKSIP